MEAFRIANRAMAKAAKRRLGVMQGKPETAVQPAWQPFQLAFLLMNLKGIAQPSDADREVVDLLFFPTGGGKTEAYLGLAAFTLVLLDALTRASPRQASASSCQHAPSADSRPTRPCRNLDLCGGSKRQFRRRHKIGRVAV